MADKEKGRRATFVRDITDAGSGKTFTANSTVTLTEGEYANYAAAGLLANATEKAGSDKPA
ncbi:hypothetical protein EYB45_08490 [Erythrobacteraceae bacterium CFH 75059]|uniref:hypothetical protein n=1 Tax=Qipengyuania thermophila TaxID=2509361 RepID=UPI00101EDF48|nr:hypothetical protein [Qipengyuania thermophila]TCD04276.1 hypothetical protein EYB45_08490 [Erythrobacteraceae bacterium CFH 75059]